MLVVRVGVNMQAFAHNPVGLENRTPLISSYATHRHAHLEIISEIILVFIVGPDYSTVVHHSL